MERTRLRPSEAVSKPAYHEGYRLFGQGSCGQRRAGECGREGLNLGPAGGAPRALLRSDREGHLVIFGLPWRVNAPLRKEPGT